MKIVDNLYAYLWPGQTMEEMETHGNNCNSYIIAHSFLSQGRTGHILIDPGHVVNEMGIDCLSNLLAEMAEDGLKAEDIALVIGTHSHPDHFEASQWFKEKQGALVALSEKEEKYLDAFGKGIYRMLGLKPPQLKPDIHLEEGEFPLDKTKLEVLLTPGHSPGSISLYWRDKKALIVGDVVFYGNTGRVDIPGGSGKTLKENIERLSRLEVDYLLTGHQYEAPGIIAGAENIKQNFDFVRKNIFPYL